MRDALWLEVPSMRLSKKVHLRMVVVTSVLEKHQQVRKLNNKWKSCYQTVEYTNNAVATNEPLPMLLSLLQDMIFSEELP